MVRLEELNNKRVSVIAINYDSELNGEIVIKDECQKYLLIKFFEDEQDGYRSNMDFALIDLSESELEEWKQKNRSATFFGGIEMILGFSLPSRLTHYWSLSLCETNDMLNPIFLAYTKNCDDWYPYAAVDYHPEWLKINKLN